MTQYVPLTRELCLQKLRRAEEIWAQVDIDAIASRFAEDCVVHCAHLPVLRGKAAVRKFMRARHARMKDYRLHKRLLAFETNKVVNDFTGSWIDTETGNKLEIYAIEVSIDGGSGEIVEWYSAVGPLPGPGAVAPPLVSSNYQP